MRVNFSLIFVVICVIFRTPSTPVSPGIVKTPNEDKSKKFFSSPNRQNGNKTPPKAKSAKSPVRKSAPRFKDDRSHDETPDSPEHVREPRDRTRAPPSFYQQQSWNGSTDYSEPETDSGYCPPPRREPQADEGPKGYYERYFNKEPEEAPPSSNGATNGDAEQDFQQPEAEEEMPQDQEEEEDVDPQHEEIFEEIR